MTPWTSAVGSLIADAEGTGAKVIGVTGDRPGVGVSLLSKELAAGYIQHGMRSILIDASRVDFTAVEPAHRANANLDLLSMAERAADGVLFIDFARHAAVLPRDGQAMLDFFGQAAANDVAIIVDLPAVPAHSFHVAKTLRLIGPACHRAYLVCLAGAVTKGQLGDCIRECMINHLPLGGIIVNDWKNPMAKLAFGR